MPSHQNPIQPLEDSVESVESRVEHHTNTNNREKHAKKLRERERGENRNKITKNK